MRHLRVTAHGVAAVARVSRQPETERPSGSNGVCLSLRERDRGNGLDPTRPVRGVGRGLDGSEPVSVSVQTSLGLKLSIPFRGECGRDRAQPVDVQ